MPATKVLVFLQERRHEQLTGTGTLCKHGFGRKAYEVWPDCQGKAYDVNRLKNDIMFGDMMGMMGKLKETQEKVAAAKKGMDTVLIDEKSTDGLLEITITANRELKSIRISDSLLADKDQLEDYLILSLNKAIAKATTVNETELAAVAKEGMPNIPGMDSLFK